MGYVETMYNGSNELDIHDTKLRDIISLVFSETKAYAKDDYCLYGDTLYVFTSAHPAGPWIGTDVRTTSVDEELAILKSTIAYIQDTTLYVMGGN